MGSDEPRHIRFGALVVFPISQELTRLQMLQRMIPTIFQIPLLFPSLYARFLLLEYNAKSWQRFVVQNLVLSTEKTHLWKQQQQTLLGLPICL